MNMENAPGTSGPSEHVDPVRERAAEIFEAWKCDSIRLAEAAEHVLGFTAWADHAARDVAGAMLGHPDDQDARDLAFMRDLRDRVAERLSDNAYEQAEKESRVWPWQRVRNAA